MHPLNERPLSTTSSNVHHSPYSKSVTSEQIEQCQSRLQDHGTAPWQDALHRGVDNHPYQHRPQPDCLDELRSHRYELWLCWTCRHHSHHTSEGIASSPNIPSILAEAQVTDMSLHSVSVLKTQLEWQSASNDVQQYNVQLIVTPSLGSPS